MAALRQLYVALAVIGGCVGVRSDGPSGGSTAPNGDASTSAALVAIEPRQLLVTSGSIAREGPKRFSIRSPVLRAELGRVPRASAELAFVYRGPTAEEAPLPSGEIGRQLGLELRARDTCNVVYVMWHIEPSPGLVVSVKSNPGQSQHSECRDRGRSVLSPITSDLAPVIEPGQPHVLAAEIRGQRLLVSTDGRESWVGELPVAAFEFDGPVGVRARNGEFSVALRAEAAMRR